ncbi:MAG TPA: hypothetical protein VG456_13800 [Candidatus Sulfopaludibacter sp.]|jgi:hypothetical protein|nr:hypothetical protein [Candidatus Sulfopaludibacter sp.]
MSTTALIVLIGVIVIVAIAAWAFLQKRRTTTLRSRFGPEYDHAVHEYGNRTNAEKALEKRAARTERYHIRPLNEGEQRRFSDEWRQTQARFVDDPAIAIQEADHLVAEVMTLRGYPMADFDRRAEDLSVDHPNVIRNYRAAHTLAASDREGRASTEDLRRAMVHYRELFDELLEAQPSTIRDRR